MHVHTYVHTYIRITVHLRSGRGDCVGGRVTVWVVGVTVWVVGVTVWVAQPPEKWYRTVESI